MPAGAARVRTFFTGLATETATVTVAAGQTIQHDINLSELPSRPGMAKEGEIVRLSEFLVSTSREMTGAALAINEQRFAPNIKSVVSTDEFGNVAEGSVGEFLKFLPGISIEYEAGALARGIQINVVPGNFTLSSTRGTAGQGNVQLGNVYRDRTNSTATPSLVWMHDGPVWKMKAGAGYSFGRNTFRATDKGYFSNSTAQRSGATISFADIFYLRPNTITVADATGRAVPQPRTGRLALDLRTQGHVLAQFPTSPRTA